MQSEYKSKFTEIQLVGRGGYSRVYEAKSINDEKSYAIKKIPFNEEERDKVLREIKFIGELESDYVVRYVHSWVETNYYIKSNKSEYEINKFTDPKKPNLLHIQMDMCSMTLNEFIHSANIKNEDMNPYYYSIATEIFVQLLECVHYLHSYDPPIIHRDLNPKNILLINGVNNRCVKLADFGLSTFHEFEGQTHTSSTGTVFFIAPETINRKYNIKADIYSIGMIMKDLFNINFTSESYKIDQKIQKMYDKLKSICLTCVSQFPDQRPSCLEIFLKRDEWKFSQINDKSLFQQIMVFIYENIFKFNLEKFQLIKNLNLEIFKKCDYNNFIKEIEETAVIFTDNKSIFELKFIDHINNTIQIPIKELLSNEILSNIEHRQLSNETNLLLFRMLREDVIFDINKGENHMIALSKSGKLFVWGKEWCAQIGYDVIKMNKQIDSQCLTNGTILSNLSAKSINILLFGHSQRGKTTIIKTLIEPRKGTYSIGLSDTKTPKIYSFFMINKQDQKTYKLNFIDTPGLREVSKSKSHDDILSIVSKLSKNFITSLNIICFVSRAFDLNCFDIQLIQYIKNILGEEYSKISMMILTHCDEINPIHEIEDRIKKHQVSKECFEYCKLGIVRYGAIDFRKIQEYSEDIRSIIIESKIKIIEDMRLKFLNKLISCSDTSIKIPEFQFSNSKST